MQCSVAQRYLYAYVDNELNQAVTLDLVHHLLHCPPCYALFAQEEQLCRLVKLSEQTCCMPDSLKQALFDLCCKQPPKQTGPDCC